MPNDFVANNGTNNGKSMSINLDALGDVAKQAVNTGNGETPILKEEVEAIIVGTDFRMMNTIQSNQNDPAKKFFNTIFAVETQFSYRDENNQIVEATSRDNYGGLRLYPKLDDIGNPMRDATGQPIIERMWSGDTSAFGKLFTLVQGKDKTVRSYSDFFNFFKKDGLKVMIKTEETNFNGQRKPKEIIQSFL